MQHLDFLRDARFFLYTLGGKLFFRPGHIYVFLARIRRNIVFCYQFSGEKCFLLLRPPPPPPPPNHFSNGPFLKLYFGAVQSSIVSLTEWFRDYELTLQNEGGVGGRLSYFVSKD